MKGAKDVTETEGKVSCTLFYDITESYDSSPDEYSLSYDIELEEEN